MIKPKELLTSFTFVIISTKVKSSLLSNYIGMFKINIMLGLEGNGVRGKRWNDHYLTPSHLTRFVNWSPNSSLKAGITCLRY